VADGGLGRNLRRVSEANETSLKGCAKTNAILENKNKK
jgi:hypothetical protein